MNDNFFNCKKDIKYQHFSNASLRSLHAPPLKHLYQNHVLQILSLGMGLVDSRLYLPKKWFGEDYQENRQACKIPEEMTFKTKNELVKEMVNDLIEKQLFDIQCIGCDATFGSDHSFLDSLSKSIYYFASVRENERIFRHIPEVIIPEQEGLGGRFKHPRATKEPISIKSLVEDESIPWVKYVLSEGTKGATT